MSSYKTIVIEKVALLTGAVVVIAHLSGPPSHAAFDGTTVFVHLDAAANMHLNAVQQRATEINYQSDTPPALNQVAARDGMLGHVDRRIPASVTRPLAQETLHGLIIAVDEKNDRLTVQLMSNATEDFRVQDGLIFNAVHGGDRVEITIESINGAKTIVALRKE
jgi:hypothetical protein